MSKKMSDLPASPSGPARQREMLWSIGIAVSSLLAACAVVYLLSLPVPLVH